MVFKPILQNRGYFLEVLRPNLSKNVFFGVGVNAQVFKNNYPNGTWQIKEDHFWIRFPITGGYYLKKGNISPFVNIGMIASYIGMEKVETPPVDFINERINKINDFGLSYTIGAGIHINQLKIFVRFDSRTFNIFKNPNLLDLGIGYNFKK